MPKKFTRKIGLWSGASPSNKKDVRAGLKKLRSLSIETVQVASNIKQATIAESRHRKYLAGGDEQKVSALLKLLRNPQIHEILCVRGGYGTLRLLELLEKQKLSKSDKRIWGFSDQTSLQNYLYLRLGMSWVHSPMLTSNAFIHGNAKELAPWQESLKNQKPLEFTLKRLPDSYSKGTLPAAAPLIGGNLTCLATILAMRPSRTPVKPFFLFLEDLSERAYRLDRMMVIMKHSGFFKHCRGIFLGYFTECPNWSGVFVKFSQETKIPVYVGLPAGHSRPNIALPMGVNIGVKPANKNFGAIKVLFPKLEIQG